MIISKNNNPQKKKNMGFVGKTIKIIALLAFVFFTMDVDAQATRYVATTGTDTGNCTDPSAPCA